MHQVEAGNGESSSLFTSYVESAWKTAQLKSIAPSQAIPFDTSVRSPKDASKLKKIVRTANWAVTDDIRKTLWLQLCSMGQNSKVFGDETLYQESVHNAFGQGDEELHVTPFPSFVDKSYLERLHLTVEGVNIAKRILCIIANERPDITYSPTLFTVTCLFLHYLDEPSTYACISMMLTSKQRFISQTNIAYQARGLVLQDLARRYMKSWYQSLAKQCADVDCLFSEWQWWILKDLPFNYLVRIMDCYLLEGPKILYRVALSILLYYRKQNPDVVKAVKTEQEIQNSIRQFCVAIDVNVPVSKLLKTAFGIRGLSRASIGKLILRKEIYVQSKLNAQALKSTIPPSSSTGSLTIPVSRDINNSEILAHKEWREIYRWLPKRYTLNQPQLVFSTQTDGTSLSTFFGKVSGHEPTLVVIKTERGEIIGGYCSTDWAVRLNQQRTGAFFGTGESFIFQLSPSRAKYSWVGLTLAEKTPYSAQLFLSGDSSHITIGGGSGCGLTLDESLNRGRSERCDTFNNTPLVSSAGGSFIVVILEAFAFD